MVRGSAPCTAPAARDATPNSSQHQPAPTSTTIPQPPPQPPPKKKRLRAAVAFRSWRVRRLFWCLFVFFGLVGCLAG